MTTVGRNGPMRPSGDVGNKVPDRRPHDGRSCAPVNSNCTPEVTVLPILTLYINLILIAGDVLVCEFAGNEYHDIQLRAAYDIYMTYISYTT